MNVFFTRLLAILMIFLAFSGSKAKDYEITRLHVTIDISEKGQLAVIEARTYAFDGEFSYVYRDFPLTDDITFRNIQIMENGKQFSLGTSEAPFTMTKDTIAEHLRAKAFFEAEDTSRKFQFEFKADGALTRYQDATTLTYPIVTKGWDEPTQAIRVRIVPPESVDGKAIEHWVHGALAAESEVQDNGIIQIELDRLPANRRLAVRALYPQAAFTALPQKADSIRPNFREKSKRLRQEDKQRKEAIEAARARKWTILKGTIPFLLAMGLILVWLYRRYGRSPEPGRPPKQTAEPPSNHKPAEVNYLMNHQVVETEAFSATLFDLACRGFVTLEYREEKGILGITENNTIFHLNREKWEEEGNQLPLFEQELLAFLFEEMATENDQFTTKTTKKHQGKFHGFLKRWVKPIKNLAGQNQWFDERANTGRKLGATIAGTVFVICLLGAFSYTLWMLLPAGVVILFFIGSAFITRRTQEGETLYRDWKAFRKYLEKQDYLKEKETIPENTFYQYLIYGIALGLNSSEIEKIAQDFEMAFPSKQPHFLHNVAGANETLTQTMSQVVVAAVVATNMTAGGGATAGGGGGAGGAGGGGAG